MNILQENTRLQIIGTLEYFSSSEKQMLYKKSVPFVHIPEELLNQWENHSRLKTRSWYKEIWLPEEMLTLNAFDKDLNDIIKKFEIFLPDVPDILTNPKWIEIMGAAKECIQRINNK